MPFIHPNAEHERLLKDVSKAICAVAEAAPDGTFTPADVRAAAIKLGRPMGAWEVRGCLSELESRGVVAMDEDTSRWHRVG